MSIVFMIFEWLLVLALIGLVVAVISLAAVVFKLKAAAMNDAKRLYQPPLRAVKNLASTGKGIALRESVRARAMTGFAKVAAAAVGETAREVKTVAQTVHFSELKPALAGIQRGLGMLKFLSALARSATAQQASNPN